MTYPYSWLTLLGRCLAPLLMLTLSLPLAAGAAAPDTAITTTPVGMQPDAIAVDASSHAVYVANTGSNTVSVLDGATAQVTATIPVGKQPAGLAGDPSLQTLYVTNGKDGTLSVVDTATNRVTATVAVGRFPGAVAVDPVTHDVYVAAYDALGFDGIITHLDGHGHQVLATKVIGLDVNVAALAVDPGTHVLYVGEMPRDSPPELAALDGATLSAMARVDLGGLGLDVAVDPSTHGVSVTSGDFLTMIDGTSLQTLQQRPVLVPAPHSSTTFSLDQGVAVDPSTQTVYVVQVGSDGQTITDSLVSFAPATHRVIAEATLATQPGKGLAPGAVRALAVDPATHRVYVLDPMANTVIVVAGNPPRLSVPHDDRYFPQTGYRIDNDTIWDYFQRRGGVNTFGYPTSRTFPFQGFTVQFFQRRIVQLGPDGQARLLNLLDPGIMPYTSFNFSTFPGVDSGLVATAPDPTDQPAVLAWVQQHAPDVVAGAPVHFDATFASTVSAQTAFPNGGDASLLPGLDLELWGIPTSQPMMDANNHNFISLRWQRGIMLFDASCTCTQGVLLADYLKAILTGQNLPADLAQEAASSPFLDQYDLAAPHWVHNPSLLPNTDFTNAFTPE